MTLHFLHKRLTNQANLPNQTPCIAAECIEMKRSRPILYDSVSFCLVSASGKMETMAYALLDCGSQRAFYAKDCTDKLSIGGSKCVLPVKNLTSKLIAERLDGRIVFLTIKGNKTESICILNES